MSVPPQLIATAGICACYFVSALKVSSRGNVKSAQEYDDTVRVAKVCLFTCSLAPVLPNCTEFHHWALVIIFDGDDVRVVEGLVDEETRLYGVFTKEYPKVEGKYYELGQVSTSPKKVLELCETNGYNSVEYLPTWQNCQSWVKDIAAKLGEHILKKLEKYPTLMEAKPFFAATTRFCLASSNYSSRPSHMTFNSAKKLSTKSK